MRKMLLGSLMTLISITFTIASNNVEGKWRTIDEETGKIKSIVEITKKNDKLYGTITKVFDDNPNFDPICEHCNDQLKNKKIVGMQIINGLSIEKNNKWVGNKGILDPENGKYYNVKIWIDKNESNILHVRGYIAFLFRTQTWQRER